MSMQKHSYEESVKHLFDLAEIEHPKHYCKGKIECIDAIDSAVEGLDGKVAVYVAHIIRYIWRFSTKHNNPIVDLQKAKFYIERLIDYYAENKKNLNKDD